MLYIDENYGGTHVVAKFDKPFNILFGESGEGKTYLFKFLNTYLKEKNIPFMSTPLGAESKDIEYLLDSPVLTENGAVLLYDNADITLTDSICRKLSQKNITAIVSLKTLKNTKHIQRGIYAVEYTPGKLVTGKI